MSNFLTTFPLFVFKVQEYLKKSDIFYYSTVVCKFLLLVFAQNFLSCCTALIETILLWRTSIDNSQSDNIFYTVSLFYQYLCYNYHNIVFQVIIVNSQTKKFLDRGSQSYKLSHLIERDDALNKCRNYVTLKENMNKQKSIQKRVWKYARYLVISVEYQELLEDWDWWPEEREIMSSGLQLSQYDV